MKKIMPSSPHFKTKSIPHKKKKKWGAKKNSRHLGLCAEIYRPRYVTLSSSSMTRSSSPLCLSSDSRTSCATQTRIRIRIRKQKMYSSFLFFIKMNLEMHPCSSKMMVEIKIISTTSFQKFTAASWPGQISKILFTWL